MTDLATNYRHLFPIFEKVAYLNSCSQAALAIPVRAAVEGYLDEMFVRGSDWDSWIAKYEELIELTASVFHTSPQNIAITSSASAGINSVLSAFDFSKSRKTILTTTLEFPTTGQIVHAQSRRGANIIQLPSNHFGILDLQMLQDSLNPTVALVVVTHVGYQDGNMNDLKSIVKICHERNVPVLVDAYQSVGSMPIDFDEIGVDFLVGGYLKYLLGIPGVGFLLASDRSELIPTNTGWFAAREVFEMRNDKYDPANNARRFTAGTPPIPSLFAAAAGLELLQEIGLDNVWTHTAKLTRQIRSELESMGANVVTSPSSSHQGVMIAFKAHSEQLLVSHLEDKGVTVSSRGGNVRISPHFYNNASDIEKLMHEMNEVRRLWA